MNMPLRSDILAEKISCLFSEARPHTLEIEEVHSGACISWIDVIREGQFDVEKQNDKCRFRLRDRKAVCEMTQFDYDLIVSGLPRKLVHPESHTSDILAEISAIDLMTSEMEVWKVISAKSKLSLANDLHFSVY